VHGWSCEANGHRFQSFVSNAVLAQILFARIVYASQRVPQDESDMNSRINSIFIAVLFLCVNGLVSSKDVSQLRALHVMSVEDAEN